MTLRMRKRGLVAACMALLLVLTSAQAYGFEIVIDLAPNVLNLGSEGELVTVHTNIAYQDVDALTVYLNGVLIRSWKSDNRGFFVAKFLMSDIDDLPLAIDDYNALRLEGLTTDGESFEGEQDILVIERDPAGKESGKY